MNLQSS